MTEWGVVAVIVVLAGLFSTLLAPMLRLNSSITKLTVTMESTAKSLEELSKANTEDHRRIWKKEEEQDKVIGNHEYRLQDLEKHKEEI